MIVADLVAISLSAKTLCVWANQTTTCFPVAIGKPTTPTPTGVFKVRGIRTGNVRPVFGAGIIDLGNQYFIHGTNNPDSIGKEVSLGCVRMHNTDWTNLNNNYVFTEVYIND